MSASSIVRWQADVLNGDEQALNDFEDRLEAVVDSYLKTLTDTLVNPEHWRPLAKEPVEFNSLLSKVRNAIGLCMTELYNAPAPSGRPREHEERDRKIYMLRRYGKLEGLTFAEMFTENENPLSFGKIAEKLKIKSESRGHHQARPSAIAREAYEREVKRRKDSHQALTRLAQQTKDGQNQDLPKSLEDALDLPSNFLRPSPHKS